MDEQQPSSVNHRQHETIDRCKTKTKTGFQKLLIAFFVVALTAGLAGTRRVYNNASFASESSSPMKEQQQEQQEQQQEQQLLLRRNLNSAVQTETVRHKDSEESGNDETNPNIQEPPENTYNKPTYHYNNPNNKNYFLKKDDNDNDDDGDDSFNPRIAWLASFPNSGTSFTMGLVARATNTTFATNYGIEANFGSKKVPSLPIYPKHPEGPFMPDPVTSFHHRKLPYGKHVMTKTHCGGYCFNCAPKTYAYGYQEQQEQQQETTTTTTSSDYSAGFSFLGDCASGQAVDDRGNLVDVSYPPERVSRVIHLIRNPLHNLIARFHLERKHHGDANTTSDNEWLADHKDDHTGMSKFCDEQNDQRWDDEREFLESKAYFFGGHGDGDGDGSSSSSSSSRRNGDSKTISPTQSRFPTDFEAWKELVERVPCRGDLFRYVQWHNLLHQSLDYMPHSVPVLTVHYESFASPTYETTASSILGFLELAPVAGDDRGNVKWSEFHERSDYDDFFSTEQTAAVREFVRVLSSFRVWGEIQHYFR